MATNGELVSLVERAIRDPDFSASDITGYLNRAVREISGGVLMPDGGRSLPLPGLMSSDSMTTTTAAYTAMPTDYQRNLYFVTNETTDTRVRIYDSTQEFLDYYPTLSSTGSVIGVAIFGSNFYYQGIPSTAETLTRYYYRKPVDMSASDDEPDGIPDHLHESLLVHNAAEKIYLLIEDGVDGKMVNADKHGRLWRAAMLDLDKASRVNREPISFRVVRNRY